MSAAVAVRFATGRPRPALARWPRTRAAGAARAVLQAVLLLPLVRLLCRPLRVEGARHLERAEGPFVFAANHASHADTAAVLAALPWRVRLRTAPAAAEDYFFRGRLRGALASLAIGAFPFPRHGSEGLHRAEMLLDRGWNVLLFPEGTRSRDGSMGRFRPGVGLLASRGAAVVPVGIAGTRVVLAKGRRLPRRSPVAIAFGEPMRSGGGVPAAAVATGIQRRASRLRAAARLLRPAPKPPVLDRVAALARSRSGLWLVFGWAVAEALLWPIVPDVPVVLLAAAAPSRFIPLAATATAGSIAGGALGYALGAAGAGGFVLAHAPLVTARMTRHAASAMSLHGAAPLLGQPWSGIPYKVFAYQASGSGVAFAPFMALSVLGRGHRILLAGAVFAAVWAPFHRWAPRFARFFYVPFALAFAVVFGIGLGRVVAAWS